MSRGGVFFLSLFLLSLQKKAKVWSGVAFQKDVKTRNGRMDHLVPDLLPCRRTSGSGSRHYLVSS